MGKIFKNGLGKGDRANLSNPQSPQGDPNGKVRNILDGESTFSEPQADFLEKNETADGALGSYEGQVSPIKSVPSRFNPFNVFRFRKYGLQDNYDAKMHTDKALFAGGGATSGNEGGGGNSLFKYFTGNSAPDLSSQIEPYGYNEASKYIQNPTAQQIMDWSRSEKNQGNAYAATPYAYSDFLWCTDYGKIPNNRLITLRRFPWPCDDNMKMFNHDDIPVPISQAVTWFGESAGNDLNKVLPISWDLKWDKLTSKVNDITGNEIIIDDVLKALDVTETDGAAATALKVGVAKTDQNTLELMGYDEKLQTWIKDAYKDNGPYWNRVLGPVNVVNETKFRGRGMGTTMFGSTVDLNFKYSLRSYQGINSKIAFLDLITNFLSLTYNTAPFWGGGYRYFPRTGLKVAMGQGGELIESGKVTQGIFTVLNDWLASASGAAKGTIQAFKQSLNAQANSVGSEESPEVQAADERVRQADALYAEKIFDNLLANRASNLLRAPLTYRTLLEGRPIGEWHVMVGNPMNPMAMMGNMLCKSCSMSFGKKLGPDDFPTEIEFKVTLEHGKPRAKQDIESIFNHGSGAMSFNQLKPPSSAEDTFGAINRDNTKTNAPNKAPAEGESAMTNTKVVQQTGVDNPTQNSSSEALNGGKGVEFYRGRVAYQYGNLFANSGMLGDYLQKVKT